MRGLKQDRSASVVIAGHALVQNLRRGHDELAVEEPVTRRLAVALANSPWRFDPERMSRLQRAMDKPHATAPPGTRAVALKPAPPLLASAAPRPVEARHDDPPSL